MNQMYYSVNIRSPNNSKILSGNSKVNPSFQYEEPDMINVLNNNTRDLGYTKYRYKKLASPMAM